MIKNILIFCLLSCFFACTDETNETISANGEIVVDQVPAIELVSISSDSVQENTESLTFTIAYTDGNGDLGNPDPDITSIEVVDTRDEDLLVFNYHLSPRTPEGSTIAITGTLDIVLENTILLDQNNDSEQTTFSIRIQDLAGNWSNTVTTENITIYK